LDCRGRLTKEHYVSENVLSRLTGGGPLKVSGLDYSQPEDVKTIGIDNFASNMLCERHNGVLSDLDGVAGQFFGTFDEINRWLVDSDQPETRVFLFNGADIERWLLKLLCGALVSGHAGTRRGRVPNWLPRIEWVRFLFGLSDLPAGWGLYLLSAVGEQFVNSRDLTFAALSRDGDVYALVISIHGFRLMLAMQAPPNDTSGTLLEAATYRPRELVIKHGSRTGVIDLGWDGGASVHVQFTRTLDV
jgi:hypothetical protein